MSNHKHDSNERGDIVVGGGIKWYRRISFGGKPSKRFWIGSASVLAVGLLAIGAWVVFGPTNESAKTDQISQDPKYENLSLENQTNLAAATGDFAVAEAGYAQRIAEAESDEQKKLAYTERALFYLNSFSEDATKLQQGVDDALAAHEISPDYASASVVARIYEQLKDKEKAIEYYQFAIDDLQKLVDTGEYDGRNTTSEFEAAIQRLKEGS